jgi:large subunit ribosomal protein L23
MAWFWQKKEQEKDQLGAQQKAASDKRGLFTRKDADKKSSDDKATKKSVKSDAKVTGKKPATKKSGSSTRAYGILLGPIVTEKAARLAESGTFVFAVTARANKIQVAEAVAELYNVHPTHVNMVTAHAKPKNFAQRQGMQSRHRKAYVTLAKGEHIEFFESER